MGKNSQERLVSNLVVREDKSWCDVGQITGCDGGQQEATDFDDFPHNYKGKY